MTRTCTECKEELEVGPRRRHTDRCDGCLREEQIKEWNNTCGVETVDGTVLHYKISKKIS